MNPADVVKQSTIELLESQPWFIRRKDSLLQAAQAIGWIAAVVVPLVSDLPAWVSLIVGAIAYAAAGFTTAFTKGAIPPSAVSRLASKAYEIEGRTTIRSEEDAYQEVLDSRYGCCAEGECNGECCQ